jgi:hypothetical protein
MYSKTLVPHLLNELPTQPVPAKPLTRAQRLFKVQIGVIARKSNRSIAKSLGVDEGTIRRDKLTLALSKAEVFAVKAGAAVEPLLRKHQMCAAEEVRKKEEMAEKQSLFLTNRLAKLIEDWLKQFPLIASDKLHIVCEIDRWSWQHGTKSEAIHESKIKAAIEGVKPKPKQPEEVFALIEWLKVWLFAWIVKVEPDRDVRDRAFTKLRKGLELEYTGW